jgi:3-oxoacyl-[acyl-carrier-protein] synthase-3
MAQVGISSVGVCIPKKVLTNFDLEKMVDTTDEWIVTRTGIRERHILEPDENLLEMLAESARTACNRSDLKTSDLDFIVHATLTPDRICPAQSFEIAREIEAQNVFCLDINTACSGFIYGLAVAEGFLKTKNVSYGLVTAGEQISRVLDYTDRNSCVIFGDATAAVTVTNKNPEHLLLWTELGADPSMSKEVIIGGIKDLQSEDRKNFYFHQNGKTVFKFAVSKIKELFETVPLKVGIKPEQIKYLVPHQANSRILEAAKDSINCNVEFISNIEKYGNTSSVSIPLALNGAWDRFKKGDYILLVGFGGGLSWGAALLEW